ncbi:hypothetical protein CF326_g3252 [Tilletia indica]|nr:hypothetical protein CF326_g3252 [Tilletia indica]
MIAIRPFVFAAAFLAVAVVGTTPAPAPKSPTPGGTVPPSANPPAPAPGTKGKNTTAGTVPTSADPPRDTTYAACDSPSTVAAGISLVRAVKKTQTTDDLPFYLKPGTGSCNIPYTDDTLGACLNPGWIHSAYHSKCGKFATVTNPANKKTVRVEILDVCGAVEGSTFGCNDMSFTKAAFIALGGNITSGHIDSNVEWYFN